MEAFRSFSLAGSATDVLRYILCDIFSLDKNKASVKKAIEFYQALDLHHLVEEDPTDVLPPIETTVKPKPSSDDPLPYFSSSHSHRHHRRDHSRRRVGRSSDPEMTSAYAPALIELLRLPPAQRAPGRIIQLCPVLAPIEPDPVEPKRSAPRPNRPEHDPDASVIYGQGLLVCVGTGLDETVGVSTLDENAQSASGGLLLFGYDPRGTETSQPFLSSKPFVQVPLVGRDLPVQVCLINSGSHPYGSIGDREDSDCSVLPEHTDHSIQPKGKRPASDDHGIYTQCLVLTTCSALYRIDLTIRPTGSHHIQSLLDGLNPSRSSSRITSIAYCNDTGCVCVGDQNG
ncbi:unnamed protein product, partial [Echinostoma caproni]|uniref:LisH domain-containing protein n=1 Tax=Echinostoma caproni TaxID=27848 RepID=A0A183BA78_9TREM